MKSLVQDIRELADKVGRDVRFMEVCGTHTMAAFRSGLRSMLPPSVHLVSGPGCPVCVTDAGYIDAAIEIARRPNVIVTTFGDLMRVPGSESSLEHERALGADVRVVYSPRDALNLARESPTKEIVFLGVGFETTAPTVAWSILGADRAQEMNYTVLCAHKTMPHAMEALLQDHEVKIDGFLCPGHVSVITGSAVYRFISDKYRLPCVVSGFEAWDILQSIRLLLEQIVAHHPEVAIEYSRSVTEHGNHSAQEVMREVFEECDAHWRGLGTIPRSGLSIRRDYGVFDAVNVFRVPIPEGRVHPGCSCGDILRGLKTPSECKMFGKACTPLSPIGPCMVSSEGTCAAYYRYEGKVAA